MVETQEKGLSVVIEWDKNYEKNKAVIFAILFPLETETKVI